MGILQRNLGQRDGSRDSADTQESTGAGDAADGKSGEDAVTATIDAANRNAAAGAFAQSLVLIDGAATDVRSHPRVRIARAETLTRWGRHREALAELHAIEASGCRGVAMYRSLAFANAAIGRPSETLACLEKAHAPDPDTWRAHFELAIALQSAGRIDAAISHSLRALELEPENTETLFNLGAFHLQKGDAIEAEAIFRRLVERDPMHADAWKNIGVCLYRQDRVAEAMVAGRRAESIARERGLGLEMFAEIATYERDSGDSFAAVATLERNLARVPDSSAHYLYGQLLLKAGRLPEGWDQHEFRWLDTQYVSDRTYADRPVWSGQDLKGRRLLLVPDQGFGDFFQHIRYAPYLQAQGASVWLRSPPELEAIAHCCAGIDRIIGAREPMPEFDFHISVTSFPRVFATNFASIPAIVPYIRAVPARTDDWSRRITSDGRLRVGLVWAGRPTHVHDRLRSLPLPTLAPLWDVAGVAFWSLQKGAAAAEGRAIAATRPLVDVEQDLDGFGETCAAIHNLDLVITVDTAVAHLAGAMGKAVWILLHEPSEYRWLTEREDSPWYPTARLFRQKVRGDWGEVVARVKEALREWVATGGKAPVLPVRVSPAAVPVPRKGRAPRGLPGLSAVTEARVGIVQYFPDDEPMGSSLEWYGEWLQGQLALVLRWVRPGGVGMEAGAGVGAHAIALGEALGPEGHLFLYEGRPVVRRVLQQNLGANRIGNVTVMRRKLGGPGADEGSETLDELQLERLDWLKVNVPAEAQAILAGGEQTLWRLRPLLLLGAQDEAELGALAEQVKGFGYRCWRVQTRLFDPANFNRRDDDIFDGKTALALAAVPEEADAGTMPSELSEA